MTRAIALAATLLVTGCATMFPQPYAVTVPTPNEADAFTCAAARVAELGYVPEVSNRETGTIRGVKSDGQFTTTIIAQFAGAPGDRQLRITTALVNRYGQGQEQHLGSTSYTRADADAVATCAAR
jgi:hypothetical protein